MNPNVATLRILFAGLVLAGCGTTEEVEQPPAPAPPPVVQPQPAAKIEFETRTDTVTALQRAAESQAPAPAEEGQIRFMVQIGAFKDPEGANAVQALARQRYHMPVLNDYHSTLGLYQIRIGFFETQEAANAFRQRLQNEHPADYKDAWVVQLKR